MNIRINQSKTEYESLLNTNLGVAQSLAVMLNTKSGKVKVRRSKVKDVAKGLAEIAFSMGETNDIEEFAENMTETIFEAFKKVEQDQKKKKNK
jgi:hypothetical protein